VIKTADGIHRIPAIQTFTKKTGYSTWKSSCPGCNLQQ